MATLPNPKTWTAGNIPTAAEFNTDIKDAINFFKAPPRVLVSDTTDQLIVSASGWNVLNWNTTVTETDGSGMHDGTTNNSRLIAQTAGRYHITCSVQWEDPFLGLNEGDRGLQIRKNAGGNAANGTMVAVDHRHAQTYKVGSVGASQQGANGYTFLAVNDYVEVFAYQADNTDFNIDMTRYNACRFGMIWVCQ